MFKDNFHARHIRTARIFATAIFKNSFFNDDARLHHANAHVQVRQMSRYAHP